MTDTDLDKLERDVAQARARFADDLARLRSPDNLARFKDDLWAEARETKDDLVDKAKEAAKTGLSACLRSSRSGPPQTRWRQRHRRGSGVAVYSPAADCDAADRRGPVRPVADAGTPTQRRALHGPAR